MDKETLRKVQLVQLEIAKEIKRVCEENNIKYFLTAGTAIGAVRHKAFIPWDDDLDIGMIREEYDRFCKIAPEKLDPRFYIQNWFNDPQYPLPFSKIRKKGTTYIEGKSNVKNHVEIYVDILIYDFAPVSSDERIALGKQIVKYQRMMLMKCKFRPWYENGKKEWKKRIGYLYYQFLSLFYSHDKLVNAYEDMIRKVKPNEDVYGQTGEKKLYYFKSDWFKDTVDMPFEDSVFSLAQGYDSYLKAAYGDYMKLPPEDQRENRHQILEVDFGQ